MVLGRAAGDRGLQRGSGAGSQADRRDGDAPCGNRAFPRVRRRRLDEQTRNALASALGEDHLAAALTLGREMTFEQAVAYALQT